MDTIFGRCVDSLSDWKKLVNENFDDAEKLTEISKIKTATENFCHLHSLNQRSQAALNEVETQFNDNSTANLDELYETALKNQPASFKNITESSVWLQVFGDEVEEVVRKQSKLDERHFVALDESIACSTVFSLPVDPLSKTIIHDPYRNRKCHHVYENHHIFNYIKSMQNRAKCPYIGCRNAQLLAKDLLPDEDLKRQIEEYIREHGEEDSD